MQIPVYAFKLSTMVGEIFEIYLHQMTKNALKLYTMVGENFEVYLLKLLKMYFNCPPWLERILKFT